MDDSGRASGRALALARDAFERGDGDAAPPSTHRASESAPAERPRTSGGARVHDAIVPPVAAKPLQPVGMGPHSLQR